MVFHVLNRGVGRMNLFAKEGDYEAFERCIEKTLETCPMRICGYCLLPNHWHFVLWPERVGELAAFMQKLTVTHVRNWQEHRRRVGYGHVYQSRYKSFPVETDDYYFQVVRYVERNALRAGLVQAAEAWRWGSLWRRLRPNADDRKWLAEGPLPLPRNWRQLVNQPQTEAEVESLRRSVERSQPFGSEGWTKRIARQLGLESTLRPRGRPKLQAENSHPQAIN